MSIDAFNTFNTFKPSLFSGLELKDDGVQITLTSSIAGNFIARKDEIREIRVSSGTSILGGAKAILIVMGSDGELVRSGNLKFEHAKSMKAWIESRLPERRPEATTNTDIEVLTKLKKMLDADLITQAEYDAKKTEILARM